MKIAVSNIGWQLAEEKTIAQIMQSLEIKGVEIAPTKVWTSPLSVTSSEIEEYKSFWRSRNIEIVALQALLFGRPDLTIFDNVQTRRATLNYLIETIELGSKLGAKVLVFGAPKNRKVGILSTQEVEEISINFFYAIGEVAAKWGMFFCIEPNPQVYECDFINDSERGFELVNAVNSDGFKLHLDTASMTLSNEVIQTALERSFSKLCHFHISEPLLAPLGESNVNHLVFAETLAALNYQGWTSIEMRAQHPVCNSLNVSKSLEFAIKYYGYK